MKFAIIETGGKQYKVTPNESITIEKLSDDLKVGDKLVFDKVLLIEDEKETQVGDPYIKGATIQATLEERAKGKKLNIIRFRSKSNYHRRLGHRQTHDTVKIAAK
ncbi:MAG: 50S ribosomal protein L21 [Candidatus Pacebacteria bacterium]|nr:50S ribosomal protein L21 [Candidatus Paceibacterota bacterium]